MTLTLGIVAGEPSGDRLAAGLMRGLRGRVPDARFVGVGGDAMLAEGLEAIAPMSALAINGFADPLKRLPTLTSLMRLLLRRYAALAPDAVIGVDFNVFNLLLERLLRRRGLATAHYVSPSVYAWRPNRVRGVAASAELLLTLFPFEPRYYSGLPVHAVYVGHPLADDIDPRAGESSARLDARRRLKLPIRRPCVAVLPGSRDSEVARLLEPFLDACEHVRRRLGDVEFVVPCLSDSIECRVRAGAAARPALAVTVYRGDGRAALTACDGALVKSGTGALEAMLLRRPMVVSYRLGELSYRLVRRLLKTPFVALPNILAGRRIVPELLQHQATPEALAASLLGEMDAAARDPGYYDEFTRLHACLRRGADEGAAEAVLAWLATR